MKTKPFNIVKVENEMQVREETSDLVLNAKYTDGYISGYVVACNFAASLAAEAWVNHVFHTGLDGLIERCKNMEQVLLEKAQACQDSETHAKIKQSQMGYGDAVVRWNKRTTEQEYTTGELTPTQIAHWLADHEATLINLRGPRGYALFLMMIKR